jgi:hypothetical protein
LALLQGSIDVAHNLDSAQMRATIRALLVSVG